MVSCHQCSTPNSLDSAFCRRCGHALPEDDLREAQEKIAGWVKEGNSAFGDGRIDEAIAIATSALESNPNYIEALVLKGLCHERQGNIPEALACAERIVELNPDSELDKIRRNGLRVQLGNALAVPDSADHRARVVLALAAVLMVFSISFAAIHELTSKPIVAKTSPQAPAVTAPAYSQQQPVTQQPAAAQQPPQTVAQAPTQRMRPEPDAADDGYDNSHDGALPPPYNPIVGNIEHDDSHALPPNPTTTSQPARSDDHGDPAPAPEGDPAPDPVKVAQTAPDPGPGIINITVHKNNSSGLGGAQPIGDSPAPNRNGVEALVRAGMQQFLAQDYSTAAGTLEKALQGGGDPIRINQRLGQAYERLGRTSDAIAAYTRAVAACQKALSNGVGDRTSIQSVLNSCQSAGKVLGG